MQKSISKTGIFTNTISETNTENKKNEENTIASIRNKIQDQVFKNDIAPFVSVLIIDQNLPVIVSLKDHLTKIGFQYIYSVQNGMDGIQIFQDLYDVGINPLVILDDLISVPNSKSVIKKIFTINPDTKIILESIHEETNHKNMELINLGIYDLIKKPIRFENVQKIVHQLKKENGFIERSTDLYDQESNVDEKILSIFNILNSLSRNQIYELVDHPNDVIDRSLRSLLEDRKIIFLKSINEISCPDCNSLKIKELFQCPYCQSTEFKHVNLIEHHQCGNVSSIDSYENNICPKCRNPIKILGVDYTKLNNYYSCMECKEVFPELSETFKCLKCSNSFDIHDLSWHKSDLYKVKN